MSTPARRRGAAGAEATIGAGPLATLVPELVSDAPDPERELQRERDIASGLESLGGVLLEAVPDDAVESRRNVGRARQLRRILRRIAVIVSAAVSRGTRAARRPSRTA